MGGEGVKESWFSGLWGTSRRNNSHSEKAVLGILAFEVATLMSKVVNLWNCLSDIQIARLKEDVNSTGIAKLISDDEKYLMNLAFAEVVENLRYAAHSVARLGKKCNDPVYHRLDQLFSSPLEKSIEFYGWEYKWKKMEKKVKKMERFVAATTQLRQEMEVLLELEQTLRRMQYNPQTNRVKLLEFQQKVIWQRQEVKSLREMSPWSRTHDYIVQLMARCLVTVIERLKFLLGINQVIILDQNNTPGHHHNAETLSRSRSFVQSSVYPSENNDSMFHSGPLIRSSSLLGLPSRSKRASKKQARQTHQHVQNQNRKFHFLNTKRIAQAGPFKGCMIGGSTSPVVESCMPTSSGLSNSGAVDLSDVDGKEDPFLTNGSVLLSQCLLSNTPPCSLGSAALSLHYANIIILIEKLASSPHLIAPDARDDLYNMLTTNIKSILRARLNLYTKSLASSAYDSTRATDWSLAIMRMLEWLSPLAHNTVRWHSERNYEKHHIIPHGNLLLVQTLYFASQSKTEAAIIELLLGLNYLYRFGKEVNERVILEASGNRVYDEYSIQTDTIACNA